MRLRPLFVPLFIGFPLFLILEFGCLVYLQSTRLMNGLLKVKTVALSDFISPIQ